MSASTQEAVKGLEISSGIVTIDDDDYDPAYAKDGKPSPYITLEKAQEIEMCIRDRYVPVCFAERIKPKVFTVQASLRRCSFSLFRLADLAGSTNPSRIHSTNRITVAQIGFSSIQTIQLKKRLHTFSTKQSAPFSVSNGCRIPPN